MEETLVSALKEGGAFGLCAFLLFLMAWIIKHLMRTLDGRLDELSKRMAQMQSSVDTLPCRSQPSCPEIRK